MTQAKMSEQNDHTDSDEDSIAEPIGNEKDTESDNENSEEEKMLDSDEEVSEKQVQKFSIVCIRSSDFQIHSITYHNYHHYSFKKRLQLGCLNQV